MTHETDATRPTGANVITAMAAEERTKLEARFWPKTRHNEATGCLEWIGAIAGAGCGYGNFHIAGRKTAAAHKVAFVLAHGAFPAGLVIRHKCHNPLCVRADHLEPGTHADNARDKMDAGRGCTGPGSHRPPMTAEDATGLLGSRLLAMPLKDVLKTWNVSASTAKAVRGGRYYAETIDQHADEVLASEAAQRASGKAPDQA